MTRASPKSLLSAIIEFSGPINTKLAACGNHKGQRLDNKDAKNTRRSLSISILRRLVVRKVPYGDARVIKSIFETISHLAPKVSAA